ncbi:MAG: DUF5615 family PIN-like protein [Alphaproteobacteria bacterium]|nr:DUF5615 family PIN-like protein [Alphaproteobacteria bacterium]
MHKLLLDENISPWAAVQLRKHGHDVVHIRDRGILGQSDPEVFARALLEDRVLVTANIGDFRKLASCAEVHVGLVLIEDGSLGRVAQLEVLERVLEELAGEVDLVNRALVVRTGGDLRFEVIPPTR